MTSLGGVFRALEAAGVDLDAQAALDAVWLALRAAEARAAATPGTESAPPGRDPGAVGAGGPRPPAAPEEVEPAPPELARALTAAGRSMTRALPGAPLSRVRLPLAAGLQGERGVPGALRSLRRKVRAAAGGVDEAATVQRALADDLWLPVHRHVSERWLELTLVVDGALSMTVWQDVARDLRRTFARAAAFRDVRVWRLQSEGEEVGVLPATRPAAGDGRVSARRRPFGGGRQGLVLVLSDCVSDGWYDGRVLSILGRWSNDALVAILQVLPERMWPRTALGEAIAVRVHATAKAAPNHHLHWAADMPVPEAGWKSQDTRVAPGLCLLPVVTAEPRSLRRLARMVAGTTSESLMGALFETTVAVEPVAPAPPDPGEAPLDRVRRFWSVSSSTAAELASLLAAAPVQSTAMLRLLRHQLMPASDPSVEAEVLLSGLLTTMGDAGANRGDVPLKMDPDVRRILLENARVDRVLEMLRQVAARVSIPGIAPRTFESWLVDPSSSEGQFSPTDEIGAQVAAVLEQLGGAYARFVHPQARRDQPGPAQSSIAEPLSNLGEGLENAAREGEVRTVHVYFSAPPGFREERDEVLRAVNDSRATTGFASVKMELLPEVRELSAGDRFGSLLDRAHVFIGLVTTRGGQGRGLEDERRHALERSRETGKPTLLLFYFDEATMADAGERFKQSLHELRGRAIVESYSRPADLRLKVTAELTKLATTLAAEPEAARSPDLGHLARQATFVGRAAELERLRTWLHEAPDDRVLVVEGPSGIGKSALAVAWLDQVVAEGEWSGIFVASAAEPFEAVLKRAIHYFTGAPEGWPSSPGQLLAELVGALAGRPKSLIVLDDFDSPAGEDSGVWHGLVDAIHGPPGVPNAKLLLLMRNVGTQLNVPFLTLGALDAEAATELLRRESASDDPETLTAMASWGQGHPFFLAELARALRESSTDWAELSGRPSPRSPRDLEALLGGAVHDLPDLLQQLDGLMLRLERGERDVPIDGVLARARQAMTAFDEGSRAQVAFAMGRLLSRAGRWSAAIEALSAARAFSEAKGARGSWARETHERALARQGGGDLEGALLDLTGAHEAFVELGERVSVASTLKRRGSLRTQLRDFGGAHQDLEAALRLYEQLGDTSAATVVRSELAALARVGPAKKKPKAAPKARDVAEAAPRATRPAWAAPEPNARPAAAAKAKPKTAVKPKATPTRKKKAKGKKKK